ncbi:hypothetical protein DYE49_02745 [Treponema rectale]|uniref:Uncharacterized protein n=1 Tax=Treponema rectale TaxID=744512 RepID=A0A7M1XMT4_9SPIR|nr:hypothetical protein DYE49_02745 [Treponema rectale]
MAKLAKRNREPLKKIDYTKELTKTIYLDEMSFGQVHPMTLKKADVSNVDEYVYCGKLHKGEIKFLAGDKLGYQLPEMVGFNHGYTLEGIAPSIFEVQDALDVYSSIEKRTFNYTKKDSKLIFKGDKKKDYAIYVRFYDNCVNNVNNRWAVIFAEEK